jgi:hypothetical protein
LPCSDSLTFFQTLSEVLDDALVESPWSQVQMHCPSTVKKELLNLLFHSCLFFDILLATTFPKQHFARVKHAIPCLVLW